ncbi:glycoside hydrolase family 16 protein [Piloderma croceum F 1598]|uniref:Glycoside hydrolase family 16 protein n=1 Tax=Piloderma croceum (strain F 1598) TaxID=765440 RepID=A0A0C3AD78_PILCF|nr:glycoside hydrolase family 16 protein [Piloderma croceum F 1598]
MGAKLHNLTGVANDVHGTSEDCFNLILSACFPSRSTFGAGPGAARTITTNITRPYPTRRVTPQTQLSLASYVDKMRALEGIFAEHQRHQVRSRPVEAACTSATYNTRDHEEERDGNYPYYQADREHMPRLRPPQPTNKKYIPQLAQFAPFTHDYLHGNSTSDQWTIHTLDITRPNTYKGSAVQQAISALTKLPEDIFQSSDQQFHTIGFEYWTDRNRRLDLVQIGRKTVGSVRCC